MPPENAVDHKLRHTGRRDNIKYVVRCYTYKSADDTVESPAHIPEHCTTRYSRGVRKQDVRPQRQRKEMGGEKGRPPY